MLKRYFFLLISLSLLSKALAQQKIFCTHSCNYLGVFPTEQLYGFESDKDAQVALKAIMRHTGLPVNFTVLAGNVPNAAAIIHENKRYIVYNQSFMLAIRDSTKTNWSLVGILVHEIGHHLSGHTLDGVGSRPEKELEADRFSGFILYKMGATLEQAKIAMQQIANEEETLTHPGKSARLAAITNGWLAAKELPSPGTLPTPTIQGQNTTTPFNNIRIEHEVTQQGQKGMRIHALLETTRLNGKAGTATAWLYDANGKPLRDRNKKYATTSGFVAVSTSVIPSKGKKDRSKLSLFIPYTELHLLHGKQTIQLNLGLHVGGQVLGLVSPNVDFEVVENFLD